MSYNGIAISEKHSDVPFSSESRSGIPFNFLMRDILQFDNTVYDAMKYVHYHSYKALSIVLRPYSPPLSLSSPSPHYIVVFRMLTELAPFGLELVMEI